MLVIIEGVDGTGKSTLIKNLRAFFKKTVYVVNYSYPNHSWEMFQNAAEARGQYYASIKLFKEIIDKDPEAIIICDRFHLGEFAYGPVKRNYPEFLAEEVFEVEDELLREIGEKNIRLIILGISKPRVAMNRSKRNGEYLVELSEYAAVSSRYTIAFTKTKLPVISIPADHFKADKIFELVINFVTGKLE